jgi:hypothetical protein
VGGIMACKTGKRTKETGKNRMKNKRKGRHRNNRRRGGE